MNLIKLIKEEKKYVLLIIILLLLTLLLWTFFGSRRLPQIFQQTGNTLANTAVLSLTGPDTVSTGGSFVLELYLNTGGSDVTGVDIVIDFDETLALLDSIVPYTDNFPTFAPIIDNGGVFNETAVVSEANSSGRIAFGAVTFDFDASSITSVVNGGNIKLADLHFTAGAGNGTVNFSLEPYLSTDDTNVVSNNDSVVEDILLSVQGLTVAIGTGGVSPSPETSPSPSPNPSPSPMASICDSDTDGIIGWEEFVYLIENWSIFDDVFSQYTCIVTNWLRLWSEADPGTCPVICL